MAQVHYATGNREKYQEASLILSEIDLLHANIDLDEVQGSPEHVIRRKAEDAVKVIGAPVIVDDISVVCPALGGLPGPYIKSFLEALGDAGLAELATRAGDPRVQVQCRVAFATPSSSEIHVFLGTIDGVFVTPRGDLRYGKHSWNPIFQPDGSNRTFGEMTMEELATFSERKHALTALYNWWQTTHIGAA